MKPRTLVVTAGIIASTLFACVEPAPAPPPAAASSAPRAAARTTMTCPGQAEFLGKVAVLNLPFTPEKYTHYASPKADPNRHITVNGPILTDLANAFCIAPSFFQADLLSLKAVYINPCIELDPKKCGVPHPTVCDPNACSPGDPKIVITNSWGFRERPDQSGAAGRYIATSAGLWDAGNRALHFRDYEQRVLQALLGWNGPTYPAPMPPQPDPINTSEMTVLAALAHELGHVRWYDVFRPQPGGSYSLDYLCGGQFFQSWAGGWQRVHLPNVWRKFGEQGIDMHASGVQDKDILKAIQQGDFPQAGTLLAQIFEADAPWASYFSSISPDEDFVETYVFNVLTNASPPLTSLPVQIPNVNANNDIPSDYAANLKQDLLVKTGCVMNAPPSPSVR